VDGEIAKVENNITKLKKKQQDLEEAAKKPPPEHGELRTQGTGPKNQSVAQLIYAENRRKAGEAHKMLASLGPAIDLPLYHQPSDTAVYLRNRTQFLAFRPRLLKFLRRRQKEKEGRHRYLMKTYNKWMNEWGKRVSDLEKANNVPSVVATGATVAATTTVAITSAGSSSSTSTAAPTASAVTVLFLLKLHFYRDYGN
jgi:nuclear receptor co-repressor 1